MLWAFCVPLRVCDALGRRSILSTHVRPAGRWR